MLRRLYIWLLRMHPPAFRQRFGDEMLEIFGGAANLRAALFMTADGFISMIRQWGFRSEFRRPSPILAFSEAPPISPSFARWTPTNRGRSCCSRAASSLWPYSSE